MSNQGAAAEAPSYEGTLRHHKLAGAKLDVECPEEFLQYTAKLTNYARWRTVILGVEKSVVDSIQDQNKADEEKCLELLHRWKEKFGHGATYERLIRSFVDSRRADLADKVCEEFLKRKPEGECTVLLFLVWRYQIWLNSSYFLIAAESSGKPDSPGDIQPFISPVSATEDDQTSAVRNIPESENVESDQQASPKSPTAQRGSVSCTSTGEQEQNRGQHSSDIVISKPALPAAPQPDSTQPRKDAIGERDAAIGERDVTIGDRDVTIGERDVIIGGRDTTIGERDTTITKKDAAIERKDATIERKDKEINELEKRKRDLERYLLEKDDKIKQQKEKQSTSEKEQEKLKKARDDSEQKIAHLKGDVDQKDRELQQEKEDKHETCQQLQEQLKHERAEKRKLEKDLVEERIQHLQGVLEKASSEVDTTWQERTNLSNAIMWNEEDLTRRQDELRAERQRKCTIYTILTLISIIVVLVAILVQVVRLN